MVPRRASVTVAPAPPRPVAPRAAAVVARTVEVAPPHWSDDAPESSAPTPRYLPPFDAPLKGSPLAPRPALSTSPGVGEPWVESPALDVPAPEPSSVVAKQVITTEEAHDGEATTGAPGLSPAVRQEVLGLVRAAVAEALGPSLASLEKRLDALERRVEDAHAEAVVASQAARSAGSDSVGTRVISAPKTVFAPATRAAGEPPREAASLPPTVRPSKGRSSVATRPPPLPRASPQPRWAEAAPASPPHSAAPAFASGYVSDDEIAAFDGRRRRRTVARVVTALLLLAVTALAVTTMLSHTLPH